MGEASVMGLKQLTASRDLKVGNFIVEFATPGIGHILKQAGLDFAFFDMEHSGFSFETLKSAIRYFEAAQVPLATVSYYFASIDQLVDVMFGEALTHWTDEWAALVPEAGTSLSPEEAADRFTAPMRTLSSGAMTMSTASTYGRPWFGNDAGAQA